MITLQSDMILFAYIPLLHLGHCLLIPPPSLDQFNLAISNMDQCLDRMNARFVQQRRAIKFKRSGVMPTMGDKETGGQIISFDQFERARIFIEIALPPAQPASTLDSHMLEQMAQMMAEKMIAAQQQQAMERNPNQQDMSPMGKAPLPGVVP